MKSTGEQVDLMAAMEVDQLQSQIAELRREIDALRFEAALDACHIAGLSAQLKALIGESENCPNAAAHPLVERAEYIDSRTGLPIKKTKALPLYREAFDSEAINLDIRNPEQYRS
ncbi:MAG TPA: hypothetical protein HPP80_01185 [Rhodospirillaceae bacterium]|nr:hypothetical protein [Rhodospirillaceae bacterium]